MLLYYRILFFLIASKWTHARQISTAANQQALHFHALQKYPTYQIINAQESKLTTTEPEPQPVSTSTELPVEVATTTTTVAPPVSNDAATDFSTNSSPTNTAATTLEISTGNTIYTPDEFPHDLLEIARSKLGLKSLDEVPSISELAEFLGTDNAEETIKYIRQMTNTEQGIALIKAYLESADFTDRTDEQRRRQEQQQKQKSAHEKHEAEFAAKTRNNFLQRVAAYFHIYNIWPQSGSADAVETKRTVEQQLSKYIKPQLEYRKRVQAAAAQHAANSVTHHKQPMLVRQPLPYHYPIPLRPIAGNRVTHNDAVGMAMPPPRGFAPVHLNTPKFYVPSHIQLARATNIPPQQLQTLLQSKPKLAELAAKVSRLPLTNDRSTLIDAQLLAAVQRAIEQDDDLRKLLQTTAATLK